jgi:polyhydroxybutyrate depolymerase
MPAPTIWIIVFAVINPVLLLGLLYYFNRTNGSIMSGGRTRRYLLYVPDSHNPDISTPLVVCFHGFVQWPAHQQRLSGWNKLADQNGFLVVYPQGTSFPLRWNAGPISDDRALADRDVAFILDLIDHLSKTYNIDQDRIYANGMSNGGGMTHLLACELTDRVAAFGGVAGAYLYPGDPYQPKKKAPWIVFHGVDDPVVPYQGGSSRHRHAQIQFPPIESWIAKWAEYNGCRANPEIEKITSEVTRFRYSDCDNGAAVILYKIAGAGHTWPGGKKLPVWLTGKTYQDIDATALMWDFFSQFDLD